MEGNDDKLHFFAGVAIGASVTGLKLDPSHKDWERVLLATFISANVGLGKELLDLSRDGYTAEGKDILYTALGGLVSGAFNVYVLQKIRFGRDRKGYNNKKYNNYIYGKNNNNHDRQKR